MYYLIALNIVMIGILVQVLLTHPNTVAQIAAVALLWLVAGFYGGNMLVSGILHIFRIRSR